MHEPQLSLKIPETYRREDVPLGKIPEEEEFDSAMYSHTLKGVKNLGMIFEEVVLLQEGGVYRTVAGRRRVCSARKAGLLSVPALVLQSGTPETILAAITVLENMNRRPNPAVEAEQLDVLMAANRWEAGDVADYLGIPASHVKARMQLFRLVPEFFQRLKEGKISLSLAKVLVKLDADKQRELLDEQKLTIGAASAALREKRLGDLIPAELFKLPEGRDGEGSVATLIRVATENLEQAISRTKNGRRGKLQQALSILKEE
jgi:ParB/RepB/Spo0J family partition protein